MTAREVLATIRAAAKAQDVTMVERQSRGSHVRVQVGRCTTTVAVHSSRDIPKGTLAAIRRDLEPCLGKGWL